MSAVAALTIVQWAALVVLYLALAAVLREVRLLRGQVSRLQAALATGLTRTDPAGGPATSGGPAPGLRLETVSPGRTAIVLVATSTCPLCRLVLERLDTVVPETGSCPRVAQQIGSAPPPQSGPEPAGVDLVLLTYEEPAAWGEPPRRLRVLRDESAWSQLAHLEPPLLAWLEPDGTVRDLRLPADESDVDAAVRAWSPQPAR